MSTEKKHKTRYRKWFDSHGLADSTRLGSFPNNDIMDNDHLFRNPISTVNRKVVLGMENQTQIPDFFVTLKPVIDEEQLFIVIQVTGVSKNVNVKTINLSGIQFDLGGVKIKNNYLDGQNQNNMKVLTKIQNLKDDTNDIDVKNENFAFVNSSHFYDFVTYGGKLSNGLIRVVSLKVNNLFKKVNKKNNLHLYDAFKKHPLNENPNNKILLHVPNFDTSNIDQSKVCIKNIILAQSDEKSEVIGMCLNEESTNELKVKTQKNREKLKKAKKKLDIDTE